MSESDDRLARLEQRLADLEGRLGRSGGYGDQSAEASRDVEATNQPLPADFDSTRGAQGPQGPAATGDARGTTDFVAREGAAATPTAATRDSTTADEGSTAPGGSGAGSAELDLADLEQKVSESQYAAWNLGYEAAVRDLQSPSAARSMNPYSDLRRGGPNRA
jgi:hypothetical protein